MLVYAFQSEDTVQVLYGKTGKQSEPILYRAIWASANAADHVTPAIHPEVLSHVTKSLSQMLSAAQAHPRCVWKVYS